MAYYATSPQTYTYLWSKYRPAVLKLMVDAVDGPQQYKFLDHEFKQVNAKEKGGYAFVLQLYKGKAINIIKNSVVAKDMLIILQQSRRALELSETATYEFTLDKQFMLHVKKLEAPVEESEEATEEVPASEEPVASTESEATEEVAATEEPKKD